MKRTQTDDTTFEVEIPFDELPVALDDIGTILGYPVGTVPDHFGEMIDYVLRQLADHGTIRGGFRIIGCERRTYDYDGLYVDQVYFSMHRIVTRALRKSEKAVLFVCTLNANIETWPSESNSKNDPVLQYIIDAISSVAVEKATDLLHDTIGIEMQHRGLRITNRYSPGYCLWPVADQHLLFSLLPPKFCGVTLTESALMIPIKSVSGIIGAGHEVVFAEYLCDVCGVKDCLHRASRLARASAIIKSPDHKTGGVE